MLHRRQTRRIPLLHDEVTLTLHGYVKTVRANATDVSHGGMGLYLLERLAVGERLTITIGLWDARQQLHEETIVAAIKWVRAKGHGYAAGIEFDRLDVMAQPRLLAFLAQFESATEPIPIGPA